MITGVLNHRTTLRLGIPLLAVLVGLGSIEVASVYREHNYKELLAAEVERRAFEVTAQTLNGNVMGAVANLGLVNQAMKNVATGKVPLNDPVVMSTLQAVGKLYEASGVFMVGQDGIIQSSWDSTGKRSTGLDVRFRPYFQIAMQGKQNVYAAVSLTTGSRALYFAAPLYREISTTAPIIGASVARVGLERVDSVLKAWPGHALLLSPQQIAFASSREDWIVQMAGVATPEQLQTIRALKQFGNIFETGTPKMLPFDINDDVVSFEQRRYAVARAPVQWNDPNGEWTLMFLGDLDELMPMSLRILVGSTSGAAVLLLSTIFLLWRRRLQQANGERQKAVDELKQYTSRLERDAEAKTRLTELSTRLHQATSIESFVQILMSHISNEIGIEYAAFYVYEETSGQLSPAGGYGVLAQQLQPFHLGQGLVGQCAKDRTAIRIADTANTGIHIVWGGGHITPKTVLLLPVLNADRLGGVLVLASTGTIDQSRQTALEEVTAMAASNLEILMRNLGIEQQAVLLEKHQGMLRESESRQHEQNAMLQAIVDAIPYPVFYKGPDTRFIGFNSAYEQTFSVRRENFIGKRVLDLEYLPEADRIAYQKEDEEVISSTGNVEKEMSIPFADGKMHDTLYYVVGFTKTDGSPGGLVGTFIDVTDRKKAEDLERFNQLALGREARIVELKREVNELGKALGRGLIYASPALQEQIESPAASIVDEHKDSAASIRADFIELLKGEEIQELFQEYSSTMGVAMAIIDPQANVLVSSNWQRVCTDFHRVNKQACANCIESDTDLASKLDEGAEFTMYRCKNGMTDCAAPIIVEGVHVANAFIGQFHLHKPEISFFRKQAADFGMDAEAYVLAVEEAPVMDEAKLPHILGFLARFARLIGSLAVEKRRAKHAEKQSMAYAGTLQHERLAAMSMAEDAKRKSASSGA